jgi:hypothetical protein
MSMGSRPLLRGAAALLALAVSAGPGAAQEACPDPSVVASGFTGAMAHVRFLADDALEGREVGSPGARCAADYIAGRLEAAGLEPAGHGGSWFHTFPVPTGARLAGENELEMSGEAYEPGKAWSPLGFSASTEVEAPLVYGGHLLSRPGHPDDDWVHTDVSGRIAVVEWGDPDAPGGRSLRAAPHFKATVAAGRGAAGLVVLLPEGAELPSLEGETRDALPIPVAVVAPEAAGAVRRAARDGAPGRLATSVEPVMREARNVAALLPGSDPERAAEYVIVGAHYDHLGWGGDGSLSPDVRAIHNGADDNASGTAALLEIAAEMARGPAPERSVLFLAFTGEEKGLWGSLRFVEDPTVPLDDAVAMLNLDMVGRLSENRLTVFGMATAAEWEELVRGENRALPAPVELALAPDGYGPSDHASFYAEGIPVLHFFTNTHPEYHRPEDDWDRVNADGLRRVTELAGRVARRLAGGSGTQVAALTPVERERPTPAASEGSRDRGYGPYLGTIPDMSPREGSGLRLTGVREGSPAERAGLRAGDVVVAFGDAEVTDIYTYTYALREYEAGDVVRIVVEREGGRVAVQAVLGERR